MKVIFINSKIYEKLLPELEYTSFYRNAHIIRTYHHIIEYKKLVNEQEKHMDNLCESYIFNYKIAKERNHSEEKYINLRNNLAKKLKTSDQILKSSVKRAKNSYKYLFKGFNKFKQSVIIMESFNEQIWYEDMREILLGTIKLPISNKANEAKTYLPLERVKKLIIVSDSPIDSLYKGQLKMRDYMYKIIEKNQDIK